MRRVAACTGLAAAALLAPFGLLAQSLKGDISAGANLFEDRCTMCHVAAGGGQGPSLAGVFGRKAGMTAEFHYTAALKGSGVTWTATELDRFLAGPGEAIPGTAMAVTVPDARQRADLIAYLAARRSKP